MQPLHIVVTLVIGSPNQFPLRTPPPHLAFEIAGRLAEVGQPDRRRVDSVQVGQHLDQRVDTVVERGLVAERLEFRRQPHNPARHVLHHLERCAGHRVVVAHGDRTGDRDRGVLERGDNPVLARHVVRRRRQPVQRWPTQHPLRRVVGHQEGQVGPTARDQLGAQLAAARNADLLEVAVQRVEVKPLQRGSHRTCLPPLVSGEQIPHVFGAVDGGHIEVALS